MIQKEVEVLGTIVSISLPNKDKLLFDNCFQELKRIEEKYTRFNDNSYLMKLNSHLFTWQKIDNETLSLLEFAEDIRKKTKNYFSISQKNTLEKFGYGKKSTISIKKYFSRLFKKNYSIKKNNLKLFKEIEIGGFGKGYALKRISDILNSKKVSNYNINAGGDIIVKGNYTIYLESPLNNNNVFGKVMLKNSSLCSSSPSKRTFNSKHHLINPKLKDSNSDLLQVFIKDNNPMYCDALSTALYVMGFKEAQDYAKTHNLNVILISKTTIYSSLEFEKI